jgi:hypothetical protein
MSVLDKIRGQYIALVENNVLVPGLCWLLKPSKVVTERFPNAATILDVTNMSPMECDLFWKVFKRNYGDKIQQHFGSNAVVRHFSKAPVIIFKSLPFHHQTSQEGEQMRYSFCAVELVSSLQQPPSDRHSREQLHQDNHSSDPAVLHDDCRRSKQPYYSKYLLLRVQTRIVRVRGMHIHAHIPCPSLIVRPCASTH